VFCSPLAIRGPLGCGGYLGPEVTGGGLGPGGLGGALGYPGDGANGWPDYVATVGGTGGLEGGLGGARPPG